MDPVQTDGFRRSTLFPCLREPDATRLRVNGIKALGAVTAMLALSGCLLTCPYWPRSLTITARRFRCKLGPRINPNR